MPNNCGYSENASIFKSSEKNSHSRSKNAAKTKDLDEVLFEWLFYTRRIYFFSSYNVWKHVQYPHQPPTRVITQFRLLKAVLPLLVLPSSFCHRTRYLKEIYIYTCTRSTKSRHYIGHSFIFILVQFVIKNAFTYGRWCHSNRFLILRNHTRKYIIHVEILSISVIYSVRFLSFMRYCPKALETNVIYNSAEICHVLINGPSRWVVSKKKASGLSLSR